MNELDFEFRKLLFEKNKSEMNFYQQYCLKLLFFRTTLFAKVTNNGEFVYEKINNRF